MEFPDSFSPFLYGILGGLIITLFQRWRYSRQQKEAKAIRDRLEKRQLEKLLTDRKSVSISKTAVEDCVFWDFIDKTRIRAKSSFKNQVGLLIDVFGEMKPQEIVSFYSRLNLHYRHAYGQPILDAYQIINSVENIFTLIVFFDWLICQGETHFNNYVHNPDLIANVEISEVNTLSISHALSEIYHKKTGDILPELEDLEFNEIPLNNDDEALSELYPKLWIKYVGDIY